MTEGWVGSEVAAVGTQRLATGRLAEEEETEGGEDADDVEAEELTETTNAGWTSSEGVEGAEC